MVLRKTGYYLTILCAVHHFCSQVLVHRSTDNTDDEFCFFSGHFSNAWKQFRILSLASDILARRTKLTTKNVSGFCIAESHFFSASDHREEQWRQGEHTPAAAAKGSFLGYVPPRNWLYKANSTYCTAGEPFLYSFRQAIDENTEHKLPRTDPSGSL